MHPLVNTVYPYTILGGGRERPPPTACKFRGTCETCDMTL